MKTSDKEIEKLTKSLLQEGLETPSPDLSIRIMDRIMQEAPLVVHKVGEVQTVAQKAKMQTSLSPFTIMAFLILYLLVGGMLFMLLTQNPGNANHLILDSLKDKLPFIMTLAVIAGSMIFYSTLDKILFWGK